MKCNVDSNKCLNDRRLPFERYAPAFYENFETPKTLGMTIIRLIISIFIFPGPNYEILTPKPKSEPIQTTLQSNSQKLEMYAIPLPPKNQPVSY